MCALTSMAAAHQGHAAADCAAPPPTHTRGGAAMQPACSPIPSPLRLPLHPPRLLAASAAAADQNACCCAGWRPHRTAPAHLHMPRPAAQRWHAQLFAHLCWAECLLHVLCWEAVIGRGGECMRLGVAGKKVNASRVHTSAWLSACFTPLCTEEGRGEGQERCSWPPRRLY